MHFSCTNNRIIYIFIFDVTWLHSVNLLHSEKVFKKGKYYLVNIGKTSIEGWLYPLLVLLFVG